MIRIPALLAASLLALAFVLTAPAPGGADAPDPGYPVWVDPELSPGLRAEDAARMAREAMERSGKVAPPAPGAPGARAATSPTPILSVDCVKGDEVERVVGPTSVKKPGATLWVVRARGTFRKSVPGGGTIRNDSGYYVIDDATGLIIAVGSPADRR